MHKKLLLAGVLFLTALNCVQAGAVNDTAAQSVALNFFKITYPHTIPRGEVSAVLKYTQTEPGGAVDFYVFDINPSNGFVIVSARDEVKPVLAYSNESYFDTNFSQTGVANWVNKTSAQIHHTVLQQIAPDTRINDLWSAYAQRINPGTEKSNGLGPMLTTTWNQLPYYNEFCPINPNDGNYCVTGCVATAMAQIMKYWNYPSQGTGSFSYADDNANGYQLNIGTLSANFATTTYQWTQMPDALYSNNTAVGTLMSQCGISVAMDYSDAGSGAYVIQSQANQAFGHSGAPCAEYSYANYFLYNPNTLQGVFQSSYTATQWTNLLEAEMNAGRVIQYEGYDPAAGGHTWVCDGYDANNNLHMNWGWGGADNGFFAATNLSAGGYTFDYDDAALIGIEPLNYNPNNDTICSAAASFTYQSLGGNVLQFTNTSTANQVFISHWTFYNSAGAFTTSTVTSPQITFTGQPPYSAKLLIYDTLSATCRDSIRDSINFNPNTICFTLQPDSNGDKTSMVYSVASQNYRNYSNNPWMASEGWTWNGVPGEGKGLINFDLSQIPVGSTIVSATLWLYADTANHSEGYFGTPTYGSDNASYLRMVTSPWTDYLVTGLTQPRDTLWAEVLLPQSSNTAEDYRDLNVTQFVQYWATNPAQNFGIDLIIKDSVYYNSLIFCSSRYPDSTKRPRLDICYIPAVTCQAHASFVQQNLGNGTVRFTNTSTDNIPFTSNWTFYNSAGAFTTSNAANPQITFTGQPPYSATLIITDSVCSDTMNQIVSVTNCIAFQYASTKGEGAEIVSNDSTQNFNFAGGYRQLFAEQWSQSGAPFEARALLQYDISQIPPGSVIQNAYLSFYADANASNGYTGQPTYGSNNACELYQVTSAWNPATVSWNTQPSFSTVNGVSLAQSTNVDENYLNLDISSFTQAWVNNPSSNYGLMLKMLTASDSNSMIFCSPDYADSIQWPQLYICYLQASPCHLLASFTQQAVGSGVVQFTNTSTANSNVVLNWTFYNHAGACATSTLPDPLITFNGQPLYSATLQITDSVTGCIDTVHELVKLTTGISGPGNGAGDLSIFPNPNNGSSFNLRLPAGYDWQTTQVKVYDMLGREVGVTALERSPGLCKLSLGDDCAAGVYTVVVREYGKQVSGKVAVVK